MQLAGLLMPRLLQCRILLRFGGMSLNAWYVQQPA
jgi:hypothetical protein